MKAYSREALWIAFGVTQMEFNALEVKVAANVSRYDMIQNNALLLEHSVGIPNSRLILKNAGDVWGFDANSATRHVGSKLFSEDWGYCGEEEDDCAKHRRDGRRDKERMGLLELQSDSSENIFVG